jgi:methylmalonyl-CoA/ethylmalonyl-CoA epimerase
MKLHHIGYVVRDLEAALARFRDDGAEVLIEPATDPLQRVRVCLLRAGDAVLELVAPLDESSPIRARLSRGGGLDHLCYLVSDVEEAVEREVRQGALVVCAPCHAVVFDADVAFVHRRSGLVVELMALRQKAAPAP